MISSRLLGSIALIAVTAGFYFAALASHIWSPTGELTIQVVFLLLDIVVVALGATWLVDGASRLATRLGISELVVGLTIVALGTSAPEIAASMVAGFEGNGDISIANIIGSNVFNLCIILGIVALIKPGGIAVEHALVTRDGPVLILGTLMLIAFVGGLSSRAIPPSVESTPSSFFLLDFTLQRIEGIVLTAVLSLYLWWIYRSSTRERQVPSHGASVAGQRGTDTRSLLRDIGLVVLGLAVVIEGCHLLVGFVSNATETVKGVGALWFAHVLDIPDYLVGVTIVAAGTSAPEMVVSVMAAIRGARGISIGNLLGSTTFNALGVLGLTGIFVQPPLSDSVTISPQMLPGMLALLFLMILAVAFMWTHRRIARWEGALLVLLGIAYWVYDFVASRGTGY